MKALLYLFLGILFIIACQSCDPEPLPPPKPKPTFTVTGIAGLGGAINPTYTIVKIGESVVLTITKNPGYLIKSIKLNGSEIAISDQIKIDNITANQNVIVEFISIDIYNLTKGSDTKTDPWYYHAVEYYTPNNVYKNCLNLTGEVILTYKNYFYLNGKTEAFTQQGVSVFIANWTLVGNIFTQGEVNTVVELTDKVFSFQRLYTQPDGTVEYVRTVYWRQ